MSKKVKFVFTREDGQTLETNTINIVDTVINHLNSTSTTAALSANQGRLLNNKIMSLGHLENKLPKLIWSGILTVYRGTSEYINEAGMYPDLFQEPGLFVLKFLVMPDYMYDGGPFLTTVFIDTETSYESGTGGAIFTEMATYDGYAGPVGLLTWGGITFTNETGYVGFDYGFYYDFMDLSIGDLTIGRIDYIELLSIHRITKES